MPPALTTTPRGTMKQRILISVVKHTLTTLDLQLGILDVTELAIVLEHDFEGIPDRLKGLVEKGAGHDTECF